MKKIHSGVTNKSVKDFYLVKIYLILDFEEMHFVSIIKK